MAEYNLGSFTFPSKKKILSYLGDQLKQHDDGEVVENRDLIQLLTELVSLHKDAEQKIGQGIQNWIALSNNDLGYKTRGFRLMPIGGGEPEPFSYRDIINKPNHRAKVAEALTQEAIYVTRKFRQDSFAKGPVRCADTGEIIPTIKLANAIHRRPVRRELHNLFLASVDLSFYDVELVKAEPGSGYRLKDRALASTWVDFQQRKLDGMVIVLSKTPTYPADSA
ncbi:DUF3223 domain-containing protein [Zhihengliuella salsuginis]|uniref:Uncharacterized protein n=1 Tax=Zhihengliuella salsuginis TaxID=578222 RepID=A0ABQ3GNN8_9MICC|nr:DUF3223 domain-containing protein [Zhihengliuella salsuginis]GHD13750.1 hypothetical protein GCM10008096_30310 [Zhihengliuella salsuginis]